WIHMYPLELVPAIFPLRRGCFRGEAIHRKIPVRLSYDSICRSLESVGKARIFTGLPPHDLLLALRLSLVNLGLRGGDALEDLLETAHRDLGKRFHPVGCAHLAHVRSEEHTSELQSRSDLVCRLLLEKKKRITCCITY